MSSRKIGTGLAKLGLIVLTGALAAVALAHWRGAANASAPAQNKPALANLRGAQPLAFVENAGQLDARVAFHLQGRDTAVYFTARGLTLALTNGATPADKATPPPAAAPRQRWNLKLDFLHANPAARPVGEALTPARVSYFRGAPGGWHSGLRTYGKLVYHDLWPGIDLVYSGTTTRLKYEFHVRPGADPRRIKLAYRGTSAPLRVNRQGQLEISTPGATLRDDRPVAWQAGNKIVKTDFALYSRARGGARVYGFKVGQYDKRQPLVIDPAILVYSGFLGGSGDDEGHSVAVDASGNAYLTGVTTSAQATFPETAGPDLTYNGGLDAFVAKLAANGAGLVYCGYLGGAGDDAGHSVAVDAGGNAYVTGWTNSTQATFPVVGTLDATFNGALDAFVAKVNPNGTALVYCGYLGGDDEDEGLGIAVDAAGRAYVTGATASTQATFPVLAGPGLLFKGAVDAFVARVRADGSGLEYAGYLGGSGNDQGRGIAVDASGQAYVAGLTASTEATFPQVGPLDPSFNGGVDAFVAKLNASGTALLYSGYLGGSGIDEAYGIAVDGAGQAYLTGRTNSTEATFPELVGPDLTFNGGWDAFVARVNAVGSALSYAGYIGGSGDDEGFAIAADRKGNALVTGRTASTAATFPQINAFDLTLNGLADGFLAKVNGTGSALTYAGYLGGNGAEEGFGTAVNGLRQVYVAGRSTSADNSFPTLIGPGLGFGGAADCFAMRIDDNNVQGVKADFDGDGRTDLSVWRGPGFPANWLAVQSSNGALLNIGWGTGQAPYFDVPVPGDYDGDGKTDPAIWRGQDSLWYIRLSSTGLPFTRLWGANYAPYNDVPTPGDFDGDGKTDIAVWRPTDGVWYIIRSSDGSFLVEQWGAQGDTPVAADYDGDGKTDIAVWRGADTNWYIKRSSGGTQIISWGAGYAPYFDTPVPADYDGDGKADVAIWRGQDSLWYIRQSSNNQPFVRLWGANYAPYNDVPVPGDYDGDGKADIAVWRPTEGNWYVIRSTTGTFLVQQHGQQGDTPAPSAGVR